MTLVDCQKHLSSRIKRSKPCLYFTLILVQIEMLFFSGIMFGLNSLIPSLRAENYFASYCGSNTVLSNTTCPQSDVLFGHVLTTTVVSSTILALPLGLFFDRWGFRNTKILCSLLLLSGGLFFALSSVTRNELLFPSAAFIGASAQALATVNYPIAGLIPKYQNFIVSIYSGSLDTFVMVFIFISLTYRMGMSIFLSFLLLAVVGFFILQFDSFVLMGAVEEVTAEMNKRTSNINQIEDIQLPAENTDNVSTETKNDVGTSTINLKKHVESIYPNFKSVLRSRYYLLQLSFFVIIFFRFAYFLEQLSLQLTKSFPQSPSTTYYLLSISSYFVMISIVTSPIVGFIVDSLKNRVKPTGDTVDFYKNTMSSYGIPLLVCGITNELICIFITLPYEWAVKVAYMSFGITNSLLFSLNGSYFLLAFPKKYFGRLFGISMTVSGCVSFIQYALLVNDLYSLNIINYVLIAISVLVFIHPILLLIKI